MKQIPLKRIKRVTQSVWYLWWGEYAPSGFSHYGAKGTFYGPDNGALFVRVYWVLPGYGRETDFITKFSYVRDSVDLSIETLFSDSYSYKGHTWHPVEIGNVDGTIRNLPYTSLGAEHGYKIEAGKDDPIPNSIGWNPAYYYDIFWDIGVNNVPFHYERSMPIKAGLQRNLSCILTYYAPKIRCNYYWTLSVWFLSNDKGDWITPDSVNIYYQYSSREVDLRVGVVTTLDAGTTRVRYDRNYLLSTSDNEIRSKFRVLASDTYETLLLRFQRYCEEDAAWRLSTGYTCRSIASARAYLGSAVPRDDITIPSYDALFPNQDLRKINWHELAAEAYSGARFSDINGIAGIQDALGFGEAVSKTVQTLKSLKAKKAAAIASLYLSFHYGYNLFIADVKTLRAELARQADRRESLSKLNAMQTYSVGNKTYTARYQVFYDQFAKVKSILDELLQISDVQLTLENFWDSVPFSFVLDWFISIGDILSSIDDYANMTQHHDVICCGQSVLGECSLSPAQMGLGSGWRVDDVVMKRYDRWYQKELLLPSLVPSVTVNPFNHSVEGAALIISRK